MMVSSVHCISKKDYYVAIVSTTVETNNPEQEIEVALNMIGKIK
jgi:Rab GDP dissociation inhibitor